MDRRIAASALLEEHIGELLTEGLPDNEGPAELGRLGARLVLQRAGVASWLMDELQINRMTDLFATESRRWVSQRSPKLADRRRREQSVGMSRPSGRRHELVADLPDSDGLKGMNLGALPRRNSARLGWPLQVDLEHESLLVGFEHTCRCSFSRGKAQVPLLTEALERRPAFAPVPANGANALPPAHVTYL